MKSDRPAGISMPSGDPGRVSYPTRSGFQPAGTPVSSMTAWTSSGPSSYASKTRRSFQPSRAWSTGPKTTALDAKAALLFPDSRPASERESQKERSHGSEEPLERFKDTAQDASRPTGLERKPAS